MNDIPPPSPPATNRASDQKFCHACARVLHISAGICPSCGAYQHGATPAAAMPALGSIGGAQGTSATATSVRTSADQKHCHSCGQVLHASAPTCPKCGAQQLRASAVGATGTPTKSRVVAVVLAFLLGGIGAHKFYCGKIGLGFVYLIFFWTWIPALIALVEGIIYLVNSSSDEEFTTKYCS